MNKTTHLLSAEEKQHIASLLSTLLSDYHLHYQNLKAYHWGVRGAGFFTLHSLFEKYYTQAGERIDVIAERILSMGALPPHTYGEYIDNARLPVRCACESSWEMIRNIHSDIEKLVIYSREIICAASEVHDDVTVDMMVGYNADDEKKLWMISSYINDDNIKCEK